MGIWGNSSDIWGNNDPDADLIRHRMNAMFKPKKQFEYDDDLFFIHSPESKAYIGGKDYPNSDKDTLSTWLNMIGRDGWQIVHMEFDTLNNAWQIFFMREVQQ
jgi:hypothetical protein